MTAIVDAWRARRSPKLAELAELEGDAELKARLDQIIAPRVLGTLENLRAFDDEDSPIFSSWVLRQLESPPFTGGSAQPLLERLIDIAKRLADPRLVERTPSIIRQWTARVTPKPARVALVARLEKAASVVAARPVREPTPAEAKFEAEWSQRLMPAASTKRTAKELLADIYENPRDDAPRLVYADFLLEQGNPHGELITLQLQGGAPEREKELLKKHGKEWLGPLASVVSWGKGYSGSSFGRGFLSVADIILSAGKKLDVVVDDPGWAVVEELKGLFPYEFYARAPLRGLRRMQAAPLAIEEYRRQKTVFPSLTHLDLQSPYADWEMTAPVFPALETITLTFERGPSVEEVAMQAEAARGHVKRVVFLRWVETNARPPRIAFDALVAGVMKLAPTIPEIGLAPPFSAWPPPPPVILSAAQNCYTRSV